LPINPASPLRESFAKSRDKEKRPQVRAFSGGESGLATGISD